ncbi:hypothetical protein SDC9_208890 [bioreactor metagenome]|uniref:Uncharacterized protein n=1 Tax=bioreactor metagenome TaxID=1076179 RepID=A0A645JCJ0_9ZZZZ
MAGRIEPGANLGHVGERGRGAAGRRNPGSLPDMQEYAGAFAGAAGGVVGNDRADDIALVVAQHLFMRAPIDSIDRVLVDDLVVVAGSRVIDALQAGAGAAIGQPGGLCKRACRPRFAEQGGNCENPGGGAAVAFLLATFGCMGGGMQADAPGQA